MLQAVEQLAGTQHVLLVFQLQSLEKGTINVGTCSAALMTDLHIKQGVLVSLRGVLRRGVSAHGKGAAKSGEMQGKFKEATGSKEGKCCFKFLLLNQ